MLLLLLPPPRMPLAVARCYPSPALPPRRTPPRPPPHTPSHPPAPLAQTHTVYEHLDVTVHPIAFHLTEQLAVGFWVSV